MMDHDERGVNMVIVEGPDGSGKSTLVKMLVEESGYELVPRSVTKEAKAMVDLSEYIVTELRKGFGPRIYDRFALISSPMYLSLPEPTFSGMMMDFTWLQYRHIDMDKIDPLVIFCLPPLEQVLKNVMAGDDNLVVQKQIEVIYWSYHAYAARHYSTSHMVWDYTAPNRVRLGNLMKWAAARIEKGR